MPLSRLMKSLLILTAAVLALSAPAPAAEKPLRVFILTGQSNMEGKGSIQHLADLIADPATKAKYAHLKDGDGWVERPDVEIKFFDRRGPLTVGYAKPDNRIGPELGFGTVVGNALDEPVLLIKAAWGGRSLAVDFRPPSAGAGKFTQRDKETKELVPLPAEKYGTAYRDLVKEVKDTLATIDGEYTLSGLVFFQGFNDIINDAYTAEYGENLAHFVRDIRKDLGAPNLPIVIGELGQQGVEPEARYADKHFNFRKIQKSVAELPENKGTVAYTPTAPYVTAEKPSFDGGYHYYGRADTFYQIGEAFGTDMLKMLDRSPKE